ncbi:MAG: VapC toxin family PIN domain ribonuclease [Verrucomicrobiota bacterium]|nr:VapC toxin family PIN domain ribonuclease [Verrucomicrobiota bacterium]
MKLLADSSIWIDHLHVANEALNAALRSEHVYVHEAIIGELACGRLADRVQVLSQLMALPELPNASLAELLALLDRRKLWGRGLSWVDVQLLGAALVAGAKLWTRDRPLARVAEELSVAHNG